VQRRHGVAKRRTTTTPDDGSHRHRAEPADRKGRPAQRIPRSPSALARRKRRRATPVAAYPAEQQGIRTAAGQGIALSGIGGGAKPGAKASGIEALRGETAAGGSVQRTKARPRRGYARACGLPRQPESETLQGAGTIGTTRLSGSSGAAAPPRSAGMPARRGAAPKSAPAARPALPAYAPFLPATPSSRIPAALPRAAGPAVRPSGGASPRPAPRAPGSA
jgi:hypothetical protein